MSKLIVDLHCHPALKAYNNAVIEDLWGKFENTGRKELFDDDLKELFISCGLKKEIDDFATYSQSHLEACFKGNNRLLFATIYPIERPFVRPDRPFDAPGILPKQRKKLFQLFYRKKGKEPDYSIDQKMIQAITGFSERKAKQYIEEIKNPETVIDYFQDYLGEYHLLKNAQHTEYTSDDTILPVRFKLVNSFSEIEQLKTNEIAAIVNLEGAHSLGSYTAKDLLDKKNIDKLPPVVKEKLQQTFLDRVAILKGKKEYRFKNKTYRIEHPPFYLTLSHHFNNLISGHAQSFKGARTSRKPGFNQIFNQQNGLNDPLTDMGRALIRTLLSKQNGRRILIDTKHMSIESRREYHQIALTEFKDVPIICSHTAVNGLEDFNEAMTNRGNTKRDFASYISRMDINLTNQDIREIYDSKGIIGVCMHDGRMPGGKFKKIIAEAQGSFDTVRKAKINRLYAQLFLMNVFHIVSVAKRHIEDRNKKGENIDPRTAWDIICLGTDYDGIIDPFNHLTTAASLEDFKNICIDALVHRDSAVRKKEGSQIRLIDNARTHPYNKKIIDDLMMGLSPQAVMENVFSNTLLKFLKTYFNPDYLIRKT